jgi:hypothetical protein
MDHIRTENNLRDAKAIITGIMIGPLGNNERAIIREEEESIEKIIEKYKNGEYDAEINKYPLEPEEAIPGTRKEDGSGGGVSANRKDDGGKKTKGEPRERAHETSNEQENSEDESEDSEGED